MQRVSEHKTFKCRKFYTERIVQHFPLLTDVVYRCICLGAWTGIHFGRTHFCVHITQIKIRRLSTHTHTFQSAIFILCHFILKECILYMRLNKLIPGVISSSPLGKTDLNLYAFNPQHTSQIVPLLD